MVYDKRTMDEIALVQSAQEGNTEAFRHLFEGHKRKILGLAYQYTRNVEDSEDILQDTFIKAYHSLRKFDVRNCARFSSWLYRIGINCSIDHMRKRKRQTDNIFPGGDVTDLSDANPRSNPDVSQQKTEVRERIDQVLNTLSRKQRMIFILKHYQDLSIKEIAEYMNCTEGSVKKQLFRTVSAMKKHFRHFLQEAGCEM